MIIPSADIEAALRQHLPAELHGAAPALAQALADAMTGAASPAEAQARFAASDGLVGASAAATSSSTACLWSIARR